MTTTTSAAPSAQQIQLPDGTPWHCTAKADALMIWREIFEDECYSDAVAGVPDGGTVVDVGAHVGLASLYFSRTVTRARILAFEPAATLHRCLAQNLRQQVRGARAYHCALGSTEGAASFTYYPNAPCQSGLYPDAAKDRRATSDYLANSGVARDAVPFLLDGLHDQVPEEVDVSTLSVVIAEHGLDRIDLLKIDVERAELDVLHGIGEADWPRIRSIVMEVDGDDGCLDRCLAVVGERGYASDVQQMSWLADSTLFTVMARR